MGVMMKELEFFKEIRFYLCEEAYYGKVKDETEKAYLVDFDGFERWLPKSQLSVYENDVVVEDWLARKILGELEEQQ